MQIPKFPKLFLCFIFTSNIFYRVQKFHYIILFNKKKNVYILTKFLVNFLSNTIQLFIKYIW